MATDAYGIKAISTGDDADFHILGYTVARSASTDVLLQVRDGPDSVDQVFEIYKGGEIGVGDGSVSVPGCNFREDPDNGIYRIGADNWALSAGGTKVMDLTSSTVSIPVDVIMSALPTSDPSVAGQLWNSTGTLMVSAG